MVNSRYLLIYKVRARKGVMMVRDAGGGMRLTLDRYPLFHPAL
jgi:hypothetical protein